MEKTLVITVQIDNFDINELAGLQQALDKLLEKYTRKRVNIQVRDRLGPQLPLR